MEDVSPREIESPAPCSGPVFAAGHPSSGWQGMSSILPDIGLTPPDFRSKLASMMSAGLEQIFGDAVITLIPKNASLLLVAAT
jgi:hypothetical protein